MPARAEIGRQCGEDILDALASDANGQPPSALTASRLAALTGRDRGLVGRVIQDLIELGLVEQRQDTRSLRLGWALHVLATRVTQTRLAISGQQVLDRVAARCRESAWIVVRQGTDALTVAEATPVTSVYAVSWVGRSYPIVRSDAGPVLLMDLPDEELDELLGGAPLPPSPAPKAPRSPRGVKRLVAEARKAGHIVLDEQTEPGVALVGAPVRDFRGVLVAAIVIAGPVERFRPRISEMTTAALAAADELSTALGST